MNRIVVLGGGESGVGAAVLAKVKGFDTFLSDFSTLTDQAKEMLNKYEIPFEEGGHTPEKILNADEIIKSPGIPDTVAIVKGAVALGIPVISEIEFAGRYDRAKKICITGSNGKTTTTSLIYYILQNAGLNVGLAGNIGSSYALQVATKDFDIYVLELSSFQLDGMYDFKADIAIITNITPDHLDRYDHNMLNYIKAKFRITQNMSEKDCFIFCDDDQVTIGHIKEIVTRAKMLPISQQREVMEGAFTLDNKLTIRYNEDEYTIPTEELSLRGRHNIYNSMAAAIAGKIMNITNEVIRRSLATFNNIEHRLENVLTVKGVQYINDSKATNVNSSWYALECMERPVVWIAGGTDKGNDYSELYDLVEKKVKALICLGKDNTKLHKSFEGKIEIITDALSAKEAVEKAYEIAEDGDVVLLSPCCASFDLFKNYEDRGRQFKNAVREL
ncbi:MAG: UDP-N-acetylmuramoyl-L-alanine--D-glutamate ligase [Bacteroidales bacterium]|nr:UDP-N-acetylmuramoyl-L-alanine--D-glutamate ligase [Bacteroidales bacterium]MBO7284555.1 UDP-N-acetylmuramoyl-L-alanine--D-glutamate ligase [Bacteroidales bacterium]MBQ5748023.1 UDP-N-acetylmuramoyl-L-alanine--D-glutamate ligase [Bacteroidales bacterium]